MREFITLKRKRKVDLTVDTHVRGKHDISNKNLLAFNELSLMNLLTCNKKVYYHTSKTP